MRGFGKLYLLLALVLVLLVPGPASAQQGRVEPLPLVHTPTGVLFRVRAPQAKSVYLAGTFNGWAGSDGYTVSDPSAQLYGPDPEGVFEIFYPLTPGKHIFKYCINGSPEGWIPGPPDLPRAKDDFDTAPGQGGMMGTEFEFSLADPPWPSYIPTREMVPVAVPKRDTGEPYLRVRFFSRQARSVHVVGSWDGWAGITSRAVFSDYHAMRQTKVPYVWEKYIGPLPAGTLEYKFVVNNRQWLSDPSVLQVSQDGNTVIQVTNRDNRWLAGYTPRFGLDAVRAATEDRWGGALKWADSRNEGFNEAQTQRKPLLWIITLPQSRYSEDLMKGINSDTDLVNTFKDWVCLETPAHEVQDIMRRKRIFRVPYVVLVDSSYQPVWEKFNPSLAELKAAVAAVR